MLDKDNPAEDFYERKHLNSDLICSNFTELTEDEYYECLRWANTTLMKNYYDKQKYGTLAQIDYLYKEKDVTFRGFRHHPDVEPIKKKSKVVPTNGVKVKNMNDIEKQRDTSNKGNFHADGVTNWENTSSDGERFSQQGTNGNRKEKKTLESFNIYSKKKEARTAAKKITLS